MKSLYQINAISSGAFLFLNGAEHNEVVSPDLDANEALVKLEGKVEKETDVIEKREQKKYFNAKKLLEKNKDNPNSSFRRNLRAISKVLGASHAPQEDRDLAIAVLKKIDIDKVSQWIFNGKKSNEMTQPITDVLVFRTNEKAAIDKKIMKRESEGKSLLQSVNTLSMKYVNLLRDLPVSELLKPGFTSPEGLRALFLENGVVNFHGNNSAKMRIGAGDLYPPTQKFIKINNEVGQRSIDPKFHSKKIGYVTKKGHYLPITGGETISEIEGNQEGFGTTSIMGTESHDIKDKDGNVIDTVYGEAAYNAAFLEEIEKDVAAEKDLSDEMDTQLETVEGLESMKWKEKYIATAQIYAKEIERTMGIPYEVTLVQACLESGYGRSAIGGNHFGIKGGSGSDNTARTTEYFTGDEFHTWKEQNPSLGKDVKFKGKGSHKYSLPDNFRSYGSMKSSFIGYGKFITKSKNGQSSGRYSEAFNHVAPDVPNAPKDSKDPIRPERNPRKFLRTVIGAGYATDPNYMNKADKIARKLGLEGWNGV